MFSTSPSPREANITHRSHWSPIKLVRAGFAINPLMTLIGAFMCMMFIGALIGIFVDHRMITGVPGWVKPAQFAISFSVYEFTFLWLLTFIQGHRRLLRVLTNSIATITVIEIALMSVQVIRGTTSHFNVSTPFDTTVYVIMGVSVAILSLMNVAVEILLLFQCLPDRAFAWSLHLGMLLFIVGLSIGFLMLLPTPAQMAARNAGMRIPIAGAHSVGVLDGGPGLPFLGWSTTGGDLRIPHFVGLHSLQLLPLFGWLISRHRFSWLSSGHRSALVWTAFLSYLGLIGLLTWQALRAQPLIAPDALTLGALAGLVGATALVATAIVVHARMRPA